MQSVAQGKKVLTKDDVLNLSDRAHQYDMFRIMDKAFRIKRIDEVRQISFLPSFDWEAFLPWASENVLTVYEKHPQAIADAYDNLSLADVVRGRIMRTQEWELMPYMIELMIGGIALVRDKPSLPKFIKFNFPLKLLILARTKELREQREAFLTRLRQVYHVSSRILTTEYIPLMRFLIKHDKNFAREFIDIFVNKLGYNVEMLEKILNVELPRDVLDEVLAKKAVATTKRKKK